MSSEQIKTYELGYYYRPIEYIATSVNLFKNRITNKMILTTTSSGKQYKNDGNVDAGGVEFEIKFKWDEKSYGYTNYSHSFAKNTNTNEPLHDVSRHKGNIGVNYSPFKFLNANTNIFVAGSKKREQGDSRRPTPAYALVDMSLIFSNFFKSMEIRTSAYNLLDKKYTDPTPMGANLPGDFPQPGIEFLLELSYRL